MKRLKIWLYPLVPSMAALAVLLIARAVMAQEPEIPDVPKTGMELLDWAIVTLGAPLVYYVARWLPLFLKQQTAKTQTTIDDVVLPKLADLAMVAVKSTYQAYVKPLKAEAGGWTKAKHAEAKSLALAELKSYLGVKGLLEIARSLNGDLDKILGGFVESAVHDNKRAGEAVAALAPVEAPVATGP